MFRFSIKSLLFYTALIAACIIALGEGVKGYVLVGLGSLLGLMLGKAIYDVMTIPRDNVSDEDASAKRQE